MLHRADLLRAIATARADYADPQAEVPAATGDSLAGRRFSIHLAFGCAGPMAQRADGLAHWAWDARHRAIDLQMTPADWTDAPVLAERDSQWEAVEGFWLARPWLLADTCPRMPVDLANPGAATQAPSAAKPTAKTSAAPVAGAALAAPQTAGLAAVYTKDSSRVGRRDGRAFTATVRGDPLPAPPIAGYRLVVEGRFTAFPEGRVVRCRTPNADTEPVCLAAAEVDRVAFEDASGKLLREWRPG